MLITVKYRLNSSPINQTKMHFTGFPFGLENLEKWEGIFQSGKSQGILNRLEKSGKITQNTGKLREFQTNIIFYFLVIFKLTVYYFAEMHQIFSYKINF